MTCRDYTVPTEADGERLDRFLAAVDADLSRSQVARAVGAGQVDVNGAAAAKTGLRLSVGDRVTVRIPEPVPADAQPEELPLDIRYEDGDLVVVAKPADLVVHPADGHPGGTLVNALLHHCTDLSGLGGVLRPGIVHRLDLGTSGLLVVAKNDRAHRMLADQFQDRSVYRRYLALVRGGARMPAGGTFRTLIGRHPRDRKRFSSHVTRGREAITHWRTVLAERGLVLVEVRLETGRTHQIRVHFADAGHPVVGDPLYGGRGAAPPRGVPSMDRQALHAYALGFLHPGDGRPMTFREPPPSDLRKMLAAVWPEDELDAALRPLMEPVDRPWETTD